MIFTLLAPAHHFIRSNQTTIILPKVPPSPISSCLGSGLRKNILWGFILPIVCRIMWITWHAHGAQQGCTYGCSQEGDVGDTNAVLSCSIQCAPILLFLFKMKKCTLPDFPTIQLVSMCTRNKSRNTLLLCRFESCCSCLSSHPSGGGFVMWEWQLPGFPVSLDLHVQWWPTFTNKVADTLAREVPETGTDSKALWLLSGQCSWGCSAHQHLCNPGSL